MGLPKKTTPKQITVTLNEPKPASNSKIDIAKAVQMRLRGLTLEEIGNQFDVSKSAVYQKIKKWCPDALDVKVYKDNEADLIAALKSRILTSITDQKLQDSSAYQLVGMHGIMFDKSRLAEGKSTENVQTLLQSAMNLANEKDGI